MATRFSFPCTLLHISNFVFASDEEILGVIHSYSDGVNAKINAFEKHHESYARFLFVSHLTMCLHIINLLDAKTKPRIFNTHKRCNEWISYTEYLFFILFFSVPYTRTVSMQYQRLYLIFNKSNWLVYFGILLSGCIDWMPRILK